jgi:hypothetical protein
VTSFESEGRLKVARLTIEPVPELRDVRDIGVSMFDANLSYLEALPNGRFVVIRHPDSERGASELQLVLNWEAEVERLVGGGAN